MPRPFRTLRSMHTRYDASRVLVVIWTAGLALLALPVVAQISGAQAPAHLPNADTQNCLASVFSGPLPGKADYCLGLRDWNRGHYRSGLEFLVLASGWGNKNAQYTLGLIYYNGHHVAADRALGMAWLKLADERHNDGQITGVTRSAFKWATKTQRQDAERLFQQMRGTYGDKVAAARAWARLDHWQRSHNSAESGCVRIFGAEAAAARRMGLAGVPPQSISSMVDISPGGARTQKQRTHLSDARGGACVTVQRQHQVAQALAGEYFRGWMGVVSVGPLQSVPARATSSEH